LFITRIPHLASSIVFILQPTSRISYRLYPSIPHPESALHQALLVVRPGGALHPLSTLYFPILLFSLFPFSLHPSPRLYPVRPRGILFHSYTYFNSLAPVFWSSGGGVFLLGGNGSDSDPVRLSVTVASLHRRTSLIWSLNMGLRDPPKSP